jgi:hypothetical protein
METWAPFTGQELVITFLIWKFGGRIEVLSGNQLQTFPYLEYLPFQEERREESKLTQIIPP